MTNYPPHQPNSNPGPDYSGQPQQPDYGQSQPYNSPQYPQQDQYGQQEQYPQQDQYGQQQNSAPYGQQPADPYGQQQAQYPNQTENYQTGSFPQQAGYADQGGVGGYGGHGGGPGGPGGQDEGGKKKKKGLGLLLGIGIPAVVLIIAGILAAIFIPQYLKQQEINEAVETYNGQHDAWQSTFTEDQLVRIEGVFEGLDIAAAANGDNPGDGSFSDYCAQLDDLNGVRDELAGGEPPARPNVEDAEGNEEYDAAVQQYEQFQARYDGSSGLLGQLEEAANSMPATCSFVAAYTEVEERFQANREALTEFSSAIPQDGTFEIRDNDDGGWRITCLTASGCYDQSTSAKRQANSDAYAAAMVVHAQEMAELYSTQCPEGYSDACAAYADYWTEYAALEQDVADALLEDPLPQIEDHENVYHFLNEAESAIFDWLTSNSITSGVDDPLKTAADDFGSERDTLLDHARVVLGGEDIELESDDQDEEA